MAESDSMSACSNHKVKLGVAPADVLVFDAKIAVLLFPAASDG